MSLRCYIPMLCVGVLLASGALIQAQAQAPSAEAMIEQLKAVAPRTRGLSGVRNLTVDTATAKEVAATNAGVVPAVGSAAAPAAERPSLSLQIQFDFNSATIKSESQQALSNLAVALQSKELMEAKFAVEGHTDAKGRADYNQRLSQHRADAVREFLIGKGVDGVRLSAAGKGATEPSNKDDPLAAENRRVKIVNLQ